MELGQKIRQARLEAGLSQRQLCGSEITRNMLSQIENGAASPSMATLRFLAERLGKSVGYFLESDAVTSPNYPALTGARAAWDRGDFAGALAALENWQSPDPVFDRERALLLALTRCALARAAIADNRLPYARALLAQAGDDPGPYFSPALERERLLLLSQAGENPADLLPGLPADDRELLLRAKAALTAGEPEQAARFLDAAGDQRSPEWNYLRGECRFARKEWETAAACYLLAESCYPEAVLPRLEQCWRELGDYRRAYEYACRRREILS